MNVFGWAVKNDNEDVVCFVLEISQKIMDREEFFKFVAKNIEFIYDIQPNDEINDIPVLDLIWNVVINRNFGEDFKKKLLFEIDIEYRIGLLFSFWNNPRSLSRALEEVKTLLSEDELNLFLTKETWLHNLLYHYSKNAKFQVLSIFWRFVEKYLDKNDQKSVLLRSEKPFDEMPRDSVLMQSFANKDELSIKFMLEVGQNLFGRDKFLENLFFGKFTKNETRHLILNIRCDSCSFLRFWHWELLLLLDTA